MIAAMSKSSSRWRLRFGLALALAGALSVGACAAPESKPARAVPLVMGARANLLLAVQRCSDEHGYDPAAVEVGENALAPGEAGWRECAYAALRVHALSNPELKESYERLIAEDERMTAAVAAGTMTRSERQSHIDVLVRELRAAENSQARRGATDLRNLQVERLRGTIDGLQEFVR